MTLYALNIKFLLSVLISAFLLIQCQNGSAPINTNTSLFELIQDSPHIAGKAEYLNSPYVTAGDRLYMVGHQDGQFPDLGWHVEGEMGGIWDHPIKLMDGFMLSINKGNESFCLQKADTFINYPYANVHKYIQAVPDFQITRTQFVPDAKEGLIIEYIFKNKSTDNQLLTLNFQAMVDLRPVWLGERTNMTDGKDQISWDESQKCLVAKDSLQEWYTAWKADIPAKNHKTNNNTCSFKRKGLGAQAELSYEINIPSKEQFVIKFFIAGSYQSKEMVFNSLSELAQNAQKLLISKKRRYEEIAQIAQIKIPDAQIQQAYEWIKYNTDWLIRDVPETGRAISAGIPDYPWWFGCDSEYTLPGILATGRKDIVYSTMELLKNLSDQTNKNGRVIHEASTNGVVFNPGNINETPQFASLVWSVYQWTGDQELLNTYYPFIKQGLTWLLEENDKDQNLYPDGAGMMEIHGLDSEMIDVATYTQKAFADAAQMAKIMGDEQQASDYQHIADKLKEKINTDFWVEEFNSYADFIGTTAQANELIEAAIIRADTLKKPWAVEELENTQAKIVSYLPNQKQGFVLYHNWVVNTPMETGIAPPEKADAALKTGSKFVNPFGLFVTGLDRDETAGQDDGSFAKDKKIFSYVGAVMTLPTGVQAIAENNYGNPDQALSYLQRMTKSFNYALPGSMYEVSPDFGMIVQAWNTYALATPIVQQFFGIQPKAYQKSIHIQPLMPTSWDEASITKLPVGVNSISMKYAIHDKITKIHVTQQLEDWKIRIYFPKNKFQYWKVNGKITQTQTNTSKDWIEVKGNEISLELSNE